MNVVELENWYAQPVHCIFCGEPLQPDEQVSCKHLVYVVSSGMFCYLADRANELLGLNDEELEFSPDFTRVQLHRLGGVSGIVEKCAGAFPNITEFRVNTVSDITRIAYASCGDELVYWGHQHQSPYE